MINIKEIPVAVLETLANFIKSNNGNKEITQGGENIICVTAVEIEPEFYFRIEGIKYEEHQTFLKLNYKPQSRTSAEQCQISIDITLLETHYKKWAEIIDEYSKLKPTFEDPILKKNEEFFIKQLKLLDEDADFVSFDLERQLFLDSYLEKTSNYLKLLPKEDTQYNSKEIEELEKEVEIIRKALSSESKNKIIKRLSKFWAKAQKTGLPIIKEIFVNVISDLTTKLISGQ